MRTSGSSSARSGLAALALSAVFVLSEPVQAADADWPCPQALVPQVSAAVLWDGPTVDGLNWRGNPTAVAMVGELTPAKMKADSADQTVARAVQGLPVEEKDHLLTLVFAGVLDELNHDRARLIDGIKRYSRDQARRAEAIGKALDELTRLEQDAAPESQAKAEGMRKDLQMQERIFDERERSVRYLCLRPVAVEERLGVLARVIASHLGG